MHDQYIIQQLWCFSLIDIRVIISNKIIINIKIKIKVIISITVIISIKVIISNKVINIGAALFVIAVDLLFKECCEMAYFICVLLAGLREGSQEGRNSSRSLDY